MDQWRGDYVRGVLHEFPAATKNFVGLMVNGLLVLPVVSGLLWFFATQALAAGSVEVHQNVTLALFALAFVASLSCVACTLTGAVRLLSAVQAHLRIGQYHGPRG